MFQGSRAERGWRSCRRAQKGGEDGFLRGQGELLRRNRREGKKADGAAHVQVGSTWRGGGAAPLTALQPRPPWAARPFSPSAPAKNPSLDSTVTPVPPAGGRTGPGTRSLCRSCPSSPQGQPVPLCSSAEGGRDPVSPRVPGFELRSTRPQSPRSFPCPPAPCV